MCAGCRGPISSPTERSHRSSFPHKQSTHTYRLVFSSISACLRLVSWIKDYLFEHAQLMLSLSMAGRLMYEEVYQCSCETCRKTSCTSAIATGTNFSDTFIEHWSLVTTGCRPFICIRIIMRHSLATELMM